jgi:hypothetical protein
MMFLRVFLACAVAIAAHPALAGGCAVQQFRFANQRQIVHPNQVRRQVVQGFVQPQFVQQVVDCNQIVLEQVAPIQYFTAGYGVQQEALQYGREAELDKRIEQKLEQFMDRIIERLEKRGRPQGESPRVELPNGLPHPGYEVVKALGCVNCHNETSAAVLNKHAPTLFSQGGDWIGTEQQADKAIGAVSDNRMPPPPAAHVSDPDFITIRDFLKQSQASR